MTAPTTLERHTTGVQARTNVRWRGVKVVTAMAPFVVVLLVWELIADIGLLPRTLLPAPHSLGGAAGDLMGSQGLLSSVLVTLRRVVIGGAVGLVGGVILGSTVALNRRLAYVLEPFISFFQAVGEIGWLPVLLLWLGFNDSTIVVAVAYTVLFPVFFGTVSGFETIPVNLANSVRTLGAGRLNVLREVMLPGALPAIFTGFRTGLGFGWRTVILAELLVGGHGLGVLLFEGRQAYRTDWIMVEMIVIGVIWLALDGLVLKPLENRTVERWGVLR